VIKIKTIAEILKSIKMLNSRTVEIEFEDYAVVEKENIKPIYTLLDEFTSGKRLKKLLVVGEHTEITKEARYMIVHENELRKNNVIAEAIVVHSFAQKLICNFYILLLKKIYPTQFFTDRDKATKWLKDQ
jgi:hypothetical protein